MFKNVCGLAVFLISVFAVSGCATGRNYQADMDALNSRVSALQGQLSAKDQEISRLQSQMNDQRGALNQAEVDKRLLSEKLDSALSQLAASQSRKEKPVVKKAPKAEESDLK